MNEHELNKIKHKAANDGYAYNNHNVDEYLIAHKIDPKEVEVRGNNLAAKILSKHAGNNIDYASFINPESLYPVIYSISQDRIKTFRPQYLFGKDLTEPQIRYLYDCGYFEANIY